MAKKRIRYKPGDIFQIPCPGRRTAYGRILLDLKRLWKKTDVFDKHPDCCLAGPICSEGLLIQIFAHKGRRPPIDKFGTIKHWPPFFVVDRQISNGDFPVIGHVPVSADQLDFPEGTCSHDFPNEYYTFDKGGVSIRIEMTEEEFHSVCGVPGADPHISPSDVLEGIDGRCEVAETGFYIRDLRFSAQRSTILKRAGLSGKMTYREMADTSDGVLPEQMISATERLYPGSTC